MFPRLNPITTSLPPATQSDVLGILQREQDRAVALLGSSPLLAGLFVSYANQAAALESVTPSTETEEWKALESMVSTLQNEIDKLKPENLEMGQRLEAAAASMEAFRSQVASLKEVNATQQHDIESLRAELIESKDEYDRLVKDSNAERDALRRMVSDLEAQRAELKETIVEQQVKISKSERQGFSGFSNSLASVARLEAADVHKTGESGEHTAVVVSATKIGGEMSAKEREEQGGLGGFGKVEEAKPPAPRKNKKRGSRPLALPQVTTPVEALNTSKSDALEEFVGPGKMPMRVSVSSENERFADLDQEPSPIVYRPPLMLQAVPEAFSNSTSELTNAPQLAEEENPIPPKSLFAPQHSPQLPTPTLDPAPTIVEPEKPLSLWDRKKLKAVSPTPAQSLFAGGGATNLTVKPSLEPPPTLNPAQKLSSAWGSWEGYPMKNT